MTSWNDFLARRGAIFERQTVVAFGHPSDELAAARDAAVICDLSPIGVLRAAGADAEEFLQGQLTNDVQALEAGWSQYGAWCSPKGRVVASLLVHRVDAHTFELLLPAELLEPVRKRLALYVLRSKVVLDNASDASVRLGVGGPAAATIVAAALGATPALHRSIRIDGGALLALPDRRFFVFADPQRAPALWGLLAATTRQAGYPAWQWLTVRAGVPLITAPTQDQFVPQAMNLDALHGVSFQKGCYTGQEIVARTQYLGRLKERLVLAHSDGELPQPGVRLYSAHFGDQPCGTVVNAAHAPDGGTDLLAVLQIAAAESAEVHLGVTDGPKLTPLPLPYVIPSSSANPRGRIQ